MGAARTSSPGTRMDPRYMTTFGWRSTRNSVASVCTSAPMLTLGSRNRAHWIKMYLSAKRYHNLRHTEHPALHFPETSSLIVRLS